MRRCKGIVSTKSGLNVFVISPGLKLYRTVNFFSTQYFSSAAVIKSNNLASAFTHIIPAQPRDAVCQWSFCLKAKLHFKVQCRVMVVLLLSPYGWIPDEDVLRTWQEPIHHPSQPIHHRRQAEEQRRAGGGGDLGMSVWGTLCSEYPTGCSVQHVLRRASCSVAQWLVQPVQHPRVEVIDWEKQKIGRGYRKSINVITPAERAGTIRTQEGLILYFPKLPNFWFNKTKRCWGIGGGPRWGVSDPSMAGQVCFTIKALFYFFAFPMSWNFLLLQHTNKILDAHSKNWTTRPALKPAHYFGHV